MFFIHLFILNISDGWGCKPLWLHLMILFLTKSLKRKKNNRSCTCFISSFWLWWSMSFEVFDLHIHRRYILVIQVRNSKIDFDMEALSISCRNKHWSQYFNQILFSSTGYLTICLAVMVQAALDSRTACTTMAGHIVR